MFYCFYLLNFKYNNDKGHVLSFLVSRAAKISLNDGI